jgi:RHS repeat-associated protein
VRFAQGTETEGLILLGARVYDPKARRFLSPDPIYNLLNQFAYPANPVWFSDPSGLQGEFIGNIFGFVSFVAGVVGLFWVATPAAAVVAVVGLTAGAISSAIFFANEFNDWARSKRQRREIDLSVGSAGGGGGGGPGGGGVAGQGLGVSGPAGGFVTVIEGHAFKNGRHLGKVGGPDSAFGAGGGGQSTSMDCAGQGGGGPTSCATVPVLPVLAVFWLSRRRVRRRVS